jgi:hypothetical protein
MFDTSSQYPPTDNVKRMPADRRWPANSSKQAEGQLSTRTGTLFQPITLVMATRLSPSRTIS